MKKILFRRKTLTFTFATILLTVSVAGAALSQALSLTTNDFVPFALQTFVPCAADGAGEIVDVQGILHIQQHVTINDNRVNVKTHFQPQGGDGVGETTGDKYNAVGVTQEVDTLPIVGGAAEFTFINNFRLIGQGNDNNLQIHQTVHMTINANGDVVNTIDNTTVDCN